MADIIVDTYKLNQYAQRIADVNRRINRLDYRLNSLYSGVGLQGLWNLMQADALTCYSWRLLRCQSFLLQTASDFDKVERELVSEDPMHFNKFAFGGFSSVMSQSTMINLSSDLENNNAIDSEKSTNSLWSIIKDEISGLPEDAKSAGEALGWIEKQYGKLPHLALMFLFPVPYKMLIH